ncbi:hypothetical protein Maq22A_5p70240 (plasmid) [Methylobacterium aquaticum]|uniref:Uncharacterized protein n=1 Tax=Methylobacterium aquaticum TaxID=270351 RepID=A0A1Y0Z934_9HYPH|nr:hypothetical protein Maq22A_5p70240 [Methylobacterium aquaticum]
MRSWLLLSISPVRSQPVGSQGPSTPSIEQPFAKQKGLRRTRAAHTALDLWEAIKRAPTRFQPSKCCNDLASEGYDTT